MKRKTFDLWKRRLIVFLVVALCAGAVYGYAWTETFLVTSVSLAGVEEKEKDAVTKAVFEAVKKHTLYVFPGDKILTLNARAIKKAVAEKLPNTKETDIDILGLHAISIEVIPRTPMFRTGDGLAFDNGGILYREQNDISSLPVISFTASTTAEKSFFQRVGVLLPKIATILFPVGHILIDEHGDMYLYASSSQSRLILRKDADFDKTWLALVSALDTDPLKASFEKKRSALEYIDLRFGNKVFYKFTNNEKPAIIPEHATTTVATSTPR